MRPDGPDGFLGFACFPPTNISTLRTFPTVTQSTLSLTDLLASVRGISGGMENSYLDADTESDEECCQGVSCKGCDECGMELIAES